MDAPTRRAAPYRSSETFSARVMTVVSNVSFSASISTGASAVSGSGFASPPLPASGP